MEKTEFMHACRPQSQIARAATAISVSVTVFDKDVEGVRHFTYLDVTLSSNLTWTEYVGCYLGISPSASAVNTFPDMHNSTYYSFLIFLIFWLAQIRRVISFITR